MKAFIHLALAAILATEVAAYHPHKHLHHQLKHIKREINNDIDDKPVEGTVHSFGGKSVENNEIGNKIASDTAVTNEIANKVAPGTAVKNVYELDGKPVKNEVAEPAIESGEFVITGKTITKDGEIINEDTKPGQNNQKPKELPAPAALVLPHKSAAMVEDPNLNEIADEKIEKERIEKERIEKERIEKERIEKERIEKEKIEKQTVPVKTDGDVFSKEPSEELLAELAKEFPNDKLDCSFPDGYGAQRADWLGIGGFTGVQDTPGYVFNVSTEIGLIHTIVPPFTCREGTFCSYACPPGYEKTQWPPVHGKKGESIGGLYCSHEGRFLLTRPEVKTLCKRGQGGVTVLNKMKKKQLNACRTDYPGTESMVIPTTFYPGQEVTLTNPLQTTYMWKQNAAAEPKLTTAQYYVPLAGITKEQGCVWESKGNLKYSAGDKSPIIFGTGMIDTGSTYLSMHVNKPPFHVAMNFHMYLYVERVLKCYYNGTWSEGTGCTVEVKKTENAVIEIYDAE